MEVAILTYRCSSIWGQMSDNGIADQRKLKQEQLVGVQRFFR